MGSIQTLILCPYPPGRAASQRFRFEQYLSKCACIHQVPFWNENEWPQIYEEVGFLLKLGYTVKAFFRRIALLFSVYKYSKVFIHREATPIGPAWFEWCVVHVWRKPIIFDFDDAIWLPNSSQANAKLVGRLKNHGKTARIISWSKTVFAGNEFLAAYARKFCKDVRVVPTTIDTAGYHLPAAGNWPEKNCSSDREMQASGLELGLDTEWDVSTRAKKFNSKHDLSVNHGNTELLTIGWTGTHSTLKQLVPLFPLLQKLHALHAYRFLLIADTCPATLPSFVEYRKWSKQREIADLLEIDIGIMPLFDTAWEHGKCGFKALQYMALGIPAVVSEVGVNTEFVRDGDEGFLAEAMPLMSDMRWKNALQTLLKNENLRTEMGSRGRKRVEESYSVEVWKYAYAEVFGAM